MLPRSTSSPVFALLCLWVATLAVFASPLPLPIGNGQQTLPVAGPSRPPGVQVDLHVLFAHWDAPDEHLLLAIGETVIHAAATQPMSRTIVLVPKKKEWTLNNPKEWGHHIENIGIASFTNQEDKWKVTNEMLDVKMPPYNQKGTCLDYITMVLKQLKDRGSIDKSVQKVYENIYNQRFEHTRKMVDKLTPEEYKKLILQYTLP
ncbi:hypothetical protein EV359DRAFT_61708 [Lentinula novae-zelandiae]|nr:hypothetical protein EV359DRAFT_61708 [Lentinula novae-zelandiae]